MFIKGKDYIKWLFQFQYSSLCILLFYLVFTLLITLIGHNELANKHLIAYNDWFLCDNRLNVFYKLYAIINPEYT